MIRIPKYDTGICPRCGSRLTARLKQGRDGSSSFHLGSPVAYSHDPGQYNIICMDCGVRWAGSGKFRFAGTDEIRSLKEDWESMLEGTEQADEGAILEDMSKELWLAEGKKRNPSPSFIRNMGRKILDMISNGHVSLKPMITERYPFDRAMEGFAAMKAHNDRRIKIMIDFEGQDGGE